MRSNLCCKVITYGLNSKSDIYPVEYKISSKGISAEISILGNCTIKINSGLIGLYNLYNVSLGCAVL